jgi:Flp pilus assembly protein TadB
MPVPRVEEGKWSKERERTKSGRWRKKRSDANKPRQKRSGLKRALVALAAIIIILVVVVVLFFPQWLGLPHIFQF